MVLSIYARKANAIPESAWSNAPILYNIFAPICVPYMPKIGAEIKAAMFAIPNTKPYFFVEYEILK